MPQFLAPLLERTGTIIFLVLIIEKRIVVAVQAVKTIAFAVELVFIGPFGPGLEKMASQGFATITLLQNIILRA